MNNSAQWRKRQPQQRNTTFVRFCNMQRDRVKAALAPSYGSADDEVLLAQLSGTTWTNIHQECVIETRGSTRGCQSSVYGLMRITPK